MQTEQIIDKSLVLHKDDISATESGDEEGPTIDININNIASSCNLKCKLNLRKIAKEGTNVEYKQQKSMCSMKLRRPYATANIWSSGKIFCTGTTSEEEAKMAARRFARKIQKLGFDVKFCNFRIVNVLGTCTLPFHICISSFTKEHRHAASYEPELQSGVTYKIISPKATLKIYASGSITILAPSVGNLYSAMEHIFPLVLEFRSDENDNVDKMQ